MNIDTSKYRLDLYGITLNGAKQVSGQNAIRTICPKCHAERKATHQKQKELYVNLVNGAYKCHNCGYEGRMDSIAFLERQEKAKYLASNNSGHVRPKGIEAKAGAFSEKLIDYLVNTRHFSIETLKGMGITEQMEFMPQTKKQENCVAFNYYEQGFLINQKFRDARKNFKLVQGAELIPYNIDSCLGKEEVIVTEGEFDCCACVEAGFDSVISIPSGANSNTNWMNRFYELYFSDKKKVYIATDMDAPGIRAAEELIRRFGPEICYRVKFSDGCKDANDELIKFGKEALKHRIAEAQEIHIPEIVGVDDYEEELDVLYQCGPQPGAKTGWKNFDAIVTFGTKQLAIVTGRTNDGKSEWLDEAVLRLALRNKWNIGYWSPENTFVDHAKKLIEKLTGRSFKHEGKIGVQEDQFALCKTWLKNHVSWIKLKANEMKIHIILEKCSSLIKKNNVRLLVLDPFNYIEKENNATCSEINWDTHVVSTIRQFAVEHDILVFLVAHPRKVEMQIDGRKRRITLEDISGTSNFGNMTDYCFCVDRDDDHHVVTVFVDKVRNKQFGTKGKYANFVYQMHCGRYCPCEVGEDKNPINTDFFSDSGMWLTTGGLFDE